MMKSTPREEYFSFGKKSSIKKFMFVENYKTKNLDSIFKLSNLLIRISIKGSIPK